MSSACLRMDLFRPNAQPGSRDQSFTQSNQLHELYKQHRYQLLATWAATAPFLIPAGTQVYKGDNLNVEVQFLDTG